MGKGKGIAIVCAVVLTIGAILPAIGQAETDYERVQRQIEQLEEEKELKEQEMKRLEEALKQNRNDQDRLEAEVMRLDLQMAELQKKLDQTLLQISETEAKKAEAERQLVAAEKRVEERDRLLDNRLRLMYKSGEVSYMEVLVGSKNFGDFLQRTKSLKLIVDSDIRILEKQKEDRDLIVEKKLEIESHLADLGDLKAEQEALQQSLKEKRKEKRVVLASLREKEQELVEISEEQEQQLLNLADELEQLYNQKNKLYYQGTAMHWPVPGYFRISSGFGVRQDPFTGRLSGHKGIDIPAPAGTDIVAAADGIVTLAGYVQGYGYTVIIEHGGGIRTLYAHGLSNGFQVKAGQEVKRGQHIHEVGSTGRSTGNHLHFGVYENRVPVDPMQYFER